MKRIAIGALGVTAAAMTAAPAQAQTPEASPFTGFRVEALAGWDSLRNGSSSDLDGVAGDDIDQSIDGFLYGIGAGYDFDLGGAVVGVEGEFSESTGNEDADQALNAPFAYRASVDRDLYIGARAGMRATPNTLLYVKGGYTSTNVNAGVDDLDANDAVDYTVDVDQSLSGWRVGAGVEQSFGNMLGFGSGAYAKLEYRYSNYEKLKFDDDFFSDANAVDVDMDRHQVVAGVGIRF